jgi:hypothetical protein
MGRQILFHMLRKDCEEFLAFLRGRAPVVVTTRAGHTSKIQPADDPCSHFESLCLWNTEILPVLKRNYIPKSTRGPYYRIDGSLPVVELRLSQVGDWDGRPSLPQGRIYASFDQPNENLRKWFEFMTRWIRKNFAKCPFPYLGGYVGPAAMKWFQEGGILLPYVRPLPTPYWVSFANSQHATSKSEP